MTNLAEKLNQTSLDLLDLSARNRLISTSRSTTRSSRLDVVDELTSEVFRILVTEGKKMTFLANPRGAKDEPLTNDVEEFLVQPEGDDSEEANEPAARHTDLQLQTRHGSEKLQKRLLTLFRDAKTLEEEQGVNSLYLAMGFLRWREAKSSAKDRYAPLILIPVSLDRQNAGSKFRLTWAGDDLSTNLSLQAKMKGEFDIELPEVPTSDELDPDQYFDDVQKAIEHKSEWEVIPNDMTLWFFSFSKFLMYRDLQAENWPAERALEANEMVDSLIGGSSFRSEPAICGEDDHVDSVVDVASMVHVMDADSSQTLAIEEAVRGRSMVIQGPPGTGKSQTITNMIAAFVQRGKRVLFVSEKMAALEVVKRRLESVGLGEACLELHSHKANKKVVLQDLAATLNLGRPKVGQLDQHFEELQGHRDKLNRFAKNLHTLVEPSNLTPYQTLGHLIRLRAANVSPGEFGTLDVDAWSTTAFHERLAAVKELTVSMRELGVPAKSKWLGVQATGLLRTDVDRIEQGIRRVVQHLDQLIDASSKLAMLIGCNPVNTIAKTVRLAQLAQTLAAAPPMDIAAIDDDCWDSVPEQIRDFVTKGRDHAMALKALDGKVVESAWSLDISATRNALATQGKSPFSFLMPKYRTAVAETSALLAEQPNVKPSFMSWFFPKPTEECWAILDQMVTAKNNRKTILESTELGKRAFGTKWFGLDSDWDSLQRTCDWDTKRREHSMAQSMRPAIANVNSTSDLKPLVKQVSNHFKPVVAELDQLFSTLEYNPLKSFGEKDVRKIGMQELKARLVDWRDNAPEVLLWCGYTAHFRDAVSLGVCLRLAEGYLAWF